jgi:hypothetical protein
MMHRDAAVAGLVLKETAMAKKERLVHAEAVIEEACQVLQNLIFALLRSLMHAS